MIKGKKYILWSIVFTLVFFTAFHYISTHWMFAITRKEHTCLPYKYWIIEKGIMPGKGDYIAFKSYGVPYFADGVRWVKVIAGTQGDRIITVKVPQDPQDERDKYRETVMVNDMPMSLRIQGYVYLYPDSKAQAAEVFRVFETDTKRRAVPMAESQIIPAGKYFVTSPAQRSFDSRYWGLVNKEWVIGRAYPIK